MKHDFLKAFALGPATKVDTPAWTQQSDATIEEVIADMLAAQELGEDLATMLGIIEMVSRFPGPCQAIAVDLKERWATEYDDAQWHAAVIEARECGAAV